MPRSRQRSRKARENAESATAIAVDPTTLISSSNTGVTNTDTTTLTSDGFGMTLERPSEASLDQQWACGTRNCTTGQTWQPRETKAGAPAYGRKVISNFFGRNKKSTATIPSDVWHWSCRKCYQRTAYVAQQTGLQTCRYYLSALEIQLDRFELWRPDAKFKVQLNKGARTRLSQYFKELSKHNDKTAAKAAVYFAPISEVRNGKTTYKAQSLEHSFDIEQMQAFDARFCTGALHDIDSLRNDILKWISDRAEAGNIVSMPPMEFLITGPSDGEEINDPANNHLLWCALADERRAQDEAAAALSDAEKRQSPSQRSINLPKLSVEIPDFGRAIKRTVDDIDPENDQTLPPAKKRRVAVLPLWHPDPKLSEAVAAPPPPPLLARLGLPAASSPSPVLASPAPAQQDDGQDSTTHDVVQSIERGDCMHWHPPLYHHVGTPLEPLDWRSVFPMVIGARTASSWVCGESVLPVGKRAHSEPRGYFTGW